MNLKLEFGLHVGYGTKSFEVDKISLIRPGKSALVIDKNAEKKRIDISDGTTMEISMHYDAAKAEAARKEAAEAAARQAKFEAEYKAKQKAEQDAADEINKHNDGDLKSVEVEWYQGRVKANIAPIKISEKTTTAGVWLSANTGFLKSRLKKVLLDIPGKEPIYIDESTANTKDTLVIAENTTLVIVAWHDPQPIISGSQGRLALRRS